MRSVHDTSISLIMNNESLQPSLIINELKNNKSIYFDGGKSMSVFQSFLISSGFTVLNYNNNTNTAAIGLNSATANPDGI